MDIRTKLILVLVSTALSAMALFGWLASRLASDLFVVHTNNQLTALSQSKALQVDALLQQWQTEAARIAATIPGRNATALTDTVYPTVRLANLYAANGQLISSTSPTQAGEPRGDAAVALHETPGQPLAVIVRTPLPSAPDQGDIERNTSGSEWLEVWFEAAALERILKDSSIGIGSKLRAQLLEQAEESPDTDVIRVTQTLQAAPWQLSISVDQADVRAIIAQFQDQLRDLGLALSGLVILTGLLFGISLARPIRSLAETVNRIRQGELTLRADVRGEDEVAMVATSFNEFMDQLHRSNDIFQLGSLRVLLAIAEPQQRYLLHELMTNWRMRTTMIGAQGTLMKALTETDPDDLIQLMVIDTALADGEAEEAAAGLNSILEHCNCPVILVSNDMETLDIDELQHLGVRKILPTPVIASDLMEAILLAMGVSASPTPETDVLLPRAVPHKIMLAEDSTLIQGVMIRFLERWGHTVVAVANGREAVEQFRQGFDIIFMDLEMPEMDGLEATGLIRQAERELQYRTPIVALTARATKEDRESCMAAGMDEYLSKPVDPKVLYRVVNSFPANPQDGDSPIDWQRALSLTGGDRELLNDLIGMFPGESARHLQTIGQALDTGNAEELTRGAHSLKGAAGFLGAAQLVDIAARVEELGRSAEIDLARESMAELESETARLVDALENASPPAQT